MAVAITSARAGLGSRFGFRGGTGRRHRVDRDEVAAVDCGHPFESIRRDKRFCSATCCHRAAVRARKRMAAA